ncbi:ATPase [Seiridium cupressi]
MAPDDSASDRRIKDLEQKYIKLLEARVTELEARISSPAGRNSREVDSDGTDSDEDAVDARPDVIKTDDDDDDGTPAARYEVVLSEFNPLTGERTDRKGVVDPKAEGDTEKKSKKAFTVRKFLSTRPGGLSQDVITPTHSEVIVHFEPLQRLLGSVMKKYSSLSRTTVMTSPYQSLIWSWSSAEAAVRSQGEDDADDVVQAKADLKELMGIISTSSGSVSLDCSDSDDNNSSAGEPGSGVQGWKFSRLQVNGTVVVDFKSYYEYQPPAAPILGDPKRLDDARSDFSRDQALLTPPRVLGYALEQKRWVQSHVERLKNREEASPNIFEQKLQLRQEYKDMIRKTVEAHTRNKEDSINDHTSGKGKGLVIMLWGLPGVGKTLTAESVALLAGKPLFSVGVADIGIDGDRVETNLQKVFDLAGLWEAVLLFDEADVFLEARDSRGSDIRRNTIVSVLLRVLEYYEGILILTTNRLRSFDIAVQSRIHLALEYKDLTVEQRASIFLEFVSQLETKGFVSNMKEIKEWIDDEGKSKEFNGRQIRNVVSTAMSLAHADNRLLKKGDLTLVSKHITQFQRALQDQETIYRAAQINKPGG